MSAAWGLRACGGVVGTARRGGETDGEGPGRWLGCGQGQGRLTTAGEGREGRRERKLEKTSFGTKLENENINPNKGLEDVLIDCVGRTHYRSKMVNIQIETQTLNGTLTKWTSLSVCQCRAFIHWHVF